MATVLRIQHVSVPMPPGSGDTARSFYSDVLGLIEKAPPADLAHLDLVWFQVGGDGLEVHVFADDTGETPVTAQHLCLQVDDIGAFRAGLTARGVASEDTMAIHNRPRFFVRDPFGNQIEITQVLGEYTV